MDKSIAQMAEPLDLSMRLPDFESPSAAASQNTPVVAQNTPAKRKTLKKCKRPTVDYSESNLLRALEDINNSTLSIYSAAKQYGIPRTTLQYRLSQQFKQKGTRGPYTVFAPNEEKEIVTWLKDKEKRGHPVTLDSLKYKVTSFLKAFPRATPFKDNIPGKTWVRLFLKRHPELSLRTPEAVSLASSRVTENDIRNWFRSVHNYLLDNNLIDILQDPSRILNGDESGFSLNPIPSRVIGSTGNKNVSFVETTNSKTNITVMFSFAADGTIIPPDIILPQKRLSRDIIRSFPADWGLGCSQNGWMDTHNFILYIKKILYPNLQKNGTKFPVLYFVDGHSSHTALEAADICSDLGIILIALFPNATRILQPADVAIFRPLKMWWSRTVDAWRMNHPEERLSLTTFGPLLQKSMEEAFKKSTIINGFSSCGLYPFNADAIDYSKCITKYSNGADNRYAEAVRSSSEQEYRIVDTTDGSAPDSIGTTLDQQMEINDKIIGEENLSGNTFHEDLAALIPVPKNVMERAIQMIGLTKIMYLIEHEASLTHDEAVLAYIYKNILVLGRENEFPFDVDDFGASSTMIMNESDADSQGISYEPKEQQLLNENVPEISYPLDRTYIPDDAAEPNDNSSEHLNDIINTSENLNEIINTKGSLNDFFAVSKTPVQTKKPRKYKMKAYSILTAGERLEELRRMDRIKEEAARLRIEKLEMREKKKVQAEENKKIKQQRILERSAKRKAEEEKRQELKIKRANEKQERRNLVMKRKMEKDEKRYRGKLKIEKPEIKNMPLTSISSSNNSVDVSDEVLAWETIFDNSENADLNSLLGLDDLLDME